MAFVAASAIAAGAAAIPSIFAGIKSIGQRRQAKRIRANSVDPGYEVNQGVMQNKETLENRYNNYTLPGMSQQMNRIGTNAATAFGQGARGASSGGDVLDLATKIAYGTGQQQNDLMLQEAQGKEAALGGYLGANAAAGEERQNVNAYERQRYEAQLAEAAALYGASDQNLNSAVTGAASIGSALLMNPETKNQYTRNAQITQRAGYAGVNTNQNPYPNPVTPNTPLPARNISQRARLLGVTNTSYNGR